MKVLKFEGIEELPIELLNLASVAWGLIYFGIGAISSFTLNSIDFWSSVALLFMIFLLPLPITVLGIWFPKTAGFSLLLCVVFSVVILILLYGIKVAVTSLVIRWFIPHLVFAGTYILVGRASKASEVSRP